MRHILTSFITFHWMVFFAVLAAACTLEADGGAGSSAAGLFIHLGAATEAPPFLPSLTFAVAFGTVAALFLWVFVSATLGGGTVSEDTEEIARMAVAAAIGSLTILLLARAWTSAAPFFGETAMFLAALMASYLAIAAERWSGVSSEAADHPDLADAARVMATSAAHNSMLSRLSGRIEYGGEQR